MGKKTSKMTILFFLGNQRLKELREWKSARKMCWKPGFLFPLSKKHLVTLFPSIPEGKTSIIPATPTITIPSFIGNTVHSGFQKILFISLYLVFIFFLCIAGGKSVEESRAERKRICYCLWTEMMGLAEVVLPISYVSAVTKCELLTVSALHHFVPIHWLCK